MSGKQKRNQEDGTASNNPIKRYKNSKEALDAMESGKINYGEVIIIDERIIQKEKVRCPRCKHQFLTKSEILVNCNKCGKKFKKQEGLILPKGQKEL